MLGFPAHGFVLLALPKTASTSVVRAIGKHAEVALRGNPKLKHVNCRQFHLAIEPLLSIGGYPRESYEVCSMFREPIEWLESWWRYRRRPEIRDNPSRYTGDQSFEDFALEYMARPVPYRGRPTRFIAMSDDLDIGVDRLFRLEAPEVWQPWLSDKLGRELHFGHDNVSTEAKPADLTARTRAALTGYFGPEYDIYERLLADGQWAPPKGFVPQRA